MANFNINTDQTFNRITSIYSKWSTDKHKDSFSSIIIQNGKDEEKSVKIKTTAIHLWLFGVELVDTLLIFSKSSLIILASEAKIKQLSKLQAKFKDVSSQTLLLLEKSSVSNEDHFNKIGEILNSETKNHTFGVLTKEKQYGPLVIETEKLLLAAISHEKMDVALFFVELYMMKTPSELNFMRMAGQSVVYFSKLLVNELEQVIDKDIKITHRKLSEKIEHKLETDAAKAKEELNFNIDNLDFVYPPIIQSGTHFDLRPNAESNDKTLEYGTILCNLGMKFMNYNCLNIRTYFINATEGQRKMYQQCLEVFEGTIAKIKAGVVIKELYEQISEDLKKKNLELYEKRPSHFGFGIGLEFKEMPIAITEKNEKKIEEGMSIALIFGFNELKKSESETFAINLADTLLISSLGAENLTNRIPREYEVISYSFENEETKPSTSSSNPRKSAEKKTNAKSKNPEKPTKYESLSKGKGSKKKDGNEGRPTTSTSNAILTRTRSGRMGEAPVHVPSENKKMMDHQKELIKRKIEEYKERLEKNNFEGLESENKVLNVEDLVSYKNTKELPKDLVAGEIYLDKKRFTMLFPVEGTHFPIHISLLKNVSKFFDHPFLYLRFNFNHFSEKTKGFVFPKNHPDFYLKELCYKSTEQNKLSYVFKAAKDLQKTYKSLGSKASTIIDESAEKHLKSPILAKLKDLLLRPSITGRKTNGHLELYENGVRFTSAKGETVDIFFNQVQQVFFQPCLNPTDTDYIIALHFHCSSPVKCGGKLIEDVQVFVEAMGSAKELGKGGDSEEEDEQDEYDKKERLRINKEFEEFVKKMEQHSGLVCDIPFKKLGFMGMPAKGLVYLQPTKNYLINLLDKPFFIMCLDDVDFVCFERVFGGGKNFDLVFVFKDLSKPAVRICTIPKESLTAIKEWIDSIELIFGESKINLNWPNLILNAKTDPQGFVEDGGWTALAEDEEEGEGEEEDGEDSSFEEEEYEDSDESDDEDYEEETESEFEGEEEPEEDILDEEDEEEVESEDEKSKNRRAPPKKRGKGAE